MTERRLVLAALAVYVLTGVLLVTGVAFALVATSQGSPVETSWVDVGFVLALFTFPTVGVIVARRQPRNAVGWILIGVGLAWQLSTAAEGYGAWGLQHPAHAAAARSVLGGTSWLWSPRARPAGDISAVAVSRRAPAHAPVERLGVVHGDRLCHPDPDDHAGAG
ncbi:MAG TPA: hypothetical protein VM307_01720 [Egibacteraceae bacterium]|nr:hypothetical protein [Egibacteraceae bacterium]